MHMPPARSNYHTFERRRETAEGQGCLSGFVLPPLAALVVGIAFLSFLSRFSPETSAPAAVSININSVGFKGGETSTSLSPIFTPEIQYWGTQIIHWSAEYNLDPNLVATVMQIESCGNPDARSSAGAMGLFQVMPFHFYALDNPYDPDTNARRGLAYLKRSLDAAKGNPDLALAGYNGGISVISRPQSNWAAETQRYLYWGSGIYADSTSGASESARLDEWLSRGGGMCKRAREKLGLP
jgi:soluble lytic murein transglycosylase-like protein